MARYLIYVQHSRFRAVIKINHFSLLISVFFTNKSGAAEGASRGGALFQTSELLLEEIH